MIEVMASANLEIKLIDDTTGFSCPLIDPKEGTCPPRLLVWGLAAWNSPTPVRDCFDGFVDCIKFIQSQESYQNYFRKSGERLRQLCLDIIQGRCPVPEGHELIVRYGDCEEKRICGGEYIPPGATHFKPSESNGWVSVEEYQPAIKHESGES